MIKIDEKREVEERAERLRWARKNAQLGSVQGLCDRFYWNVNTYKAHEAGRNGFGVADARNYADAFGVSLPWLMTGVGEWNAVATPQDSVTLVPRVASVSAGALMGQDFSDDVIDHLPIAGLPQGDWLALTVDGTSMDRISPPGSIILVNRRDKRLVPNACYVIADEQGQATYKRYRPTPDRFEPVSTFEHHETLFPEHEPLIVGRVRRTILDM